MPTRLMSEIILGQSLFGTVFTSPADVCAVRYISVKAYSYPLQLESVSIFKYLKDILRGMTNVTFGSVIVTISSCIHERAKELFHGSSGVFNSAGSSAKWNFRRTGASITCFKIFVEKVK